MANKFSRNNFLKTNNVDGVIENDLTTNTLDNFEFKRPRTFYTISTEDLKRPDLISLKTLNSMAYWWIIMKLNNIESPLDELETGQSLQIPNLQDVEEYFLKNRNK
jgi:hypothetical protein